MIFHPTETTKLEIAKLSFREDSNDCNLVMNENLNIFERTRVLFINYLRNHNSDCIALLLYISGNFFSDIRLFQFNLQSRFRID